MLQIATHCRLGKDPVTRENDFGSVIQMDGHRYDDLTFGVSEAIAKTLREL